MSSPINAQLNGSFVVAATPVPIFIPLPCGYTQIKIYNDTGIAAAGAGVNAIEGKATFPAHSCIKYTGAAMVPAIDVAEGITFVADSGDQTPGAAVAMGGAGITAASPAVITSASTARPRDVVRVYGTTGMWQVAGWDFTVSATNPGVTQDIANLPAAGFAAPATAGFVRIIPFVPRMYPVTRRITAITAGVSTVIALNVTHLYTVGQKVRVTVPAGWGMVQMAGLIGTITAIGTAIGGCTNTITVDIDSSAFTAFAFPTSAIAALATGVPEVAPVGSAAVVPYGNVFDDASRNISVTGVIVDVDTNLLIANNFYSWVAYKGTTI